MPAKTFIRSLAEGFVVSIILVALAFTLAVGFLMPAFGPLKIPRRIIYNFQLLFLSFWVIFTTYFSNKKP